MADKLTPQQKQAVENRGGELLVSAAAGSGKTKVLVDRLMGYLTDPVNPANIDDFLIITYTKAAAAELRGKIAAKLTERMAQEPENRHLHRQFQRLYLTQISTVHAFCTTILRQYAYLPGIPVDFRVGDENECAELRLTAVDRVLEQAYENAAEDSAFRAFVDSQGLGRDDRQVPQIVLQVFDSARCHLQPRRWLEHCLQCTRAEGAGDAAESVYGEYLIARLYSWLDLQIEAMERCVQAAQQSDGFEKPAANLADTLVQLQKLRSCTGWDEIVANSTVTFGTLRFPKQCADEPLAAQIKAVRDACKKGLARNLRPFTGSSEVVLRDLRNTSESVQGLISLVLQFEAAYEKLKHSRRILDFGDLEHKTLDLLYGRERTSVTSAADQIGSRFREVMVDEYQDSNAVQDAIYHALTRKRHNLFMVGDVKQSIYQFRLADPGIFLEKYGSYIPAEHAQPGQGRKVQLSRNFRSGGDVLAGVNDVFRTCMSPAVGGLTYGDEEALHEGIPHIPLPYPQVQLHCVEVEEDKYEEEAAYVANIIERMLRQGQPVRSGDSLRPVTAGDIVILLRSPGSVGGYYQQALERLGIRCASGGGEDLLKTRPVDTLYALLQVIENPLLDIPLVAVLASPVFGFPADKLATIRAGKKDGCFYDALCANAETEADTAEFLSTLSGLRATARTQPVTVLLEEIFSLTAMESLCDAMDPGGAMGEKLQYFYQLAAAFESGGNGTLGRFLEHLQTLSRKGLLLGDAAPSQDCVTIMSIHKSKGLEFPVVFLCALSREFNQESLREQVLCHKELGLGLSAVDHKNRFRYPTIAKSAISACMGAQSLSEEMRVLYVAMTRARDALIMTYAAEKLEKQLQELVLRLNAGGAELLVRQAVCPGEWVLLTALGHTEAGALFNLGGQPINTAPGEPPWGIYVGAAHQPVNATGTNTDRQTEKVDIDRLRQLIGSVYSYEAATRLPSKQTATQRKGREKDEEAAKLTPMAYTPPSWRQASFRCEAGGIPLGNAIHAAMQYLRYDCCGSKEQIAVELDRLVSSHLLTGQQRQMIDPAMLERFFRSELGSRLCRPGANLIREFKFSILDDGAAYDPECAGEQVLLQGVVDCALVEDDGIILLDFKTDRVTPETLSKVAEDYRLQLETYASALKRIYRKPVMEKYLYFFRMNCFYPI